jgi:hypothetical protein
MEEANYIFAFINFGRALDTLKTTFGKIFFNEEFPNSKVIIASNKPRDEISAALGTTDYCYLNIDKSPSVASGKNTILRHADEMHYKKVFIIEDDVLIDDTSVFNDYNTIIEQYKLGMIFFGFGGQTNHVFHKCNPRLIFTAANQMPVMWNSIPCGALQLFNLEINKELFNPELRYNDLKEYLVRLKGKNLIPFLGIYMDANDSYKRIHTVSMPSCRAKNQMEAMIESEALRRAGFQYAAEGNVDRIIEFVKEHQEKINDK